MTNETNNLAGQETFEQHAWLQAVLIGGEPIDKELEDFIYRVAHNLKNPLGVIVSYADYLQKFGMQMPAEELQEDFDIIWYNGHQMNNIIDELLVLISLHTEKIVPEPLDMAEIVADVQDRLAYLIDVHQARLEVPDDWLPALGYSSWVEEVWINYLSNAIKYGGNPPQAELGATLRNNDIVQFWIRDNGDGLTSEKQAQVFAPLSELNQLRFKGDGLGLPIVRYIVEKLGGWVSVESEGVSGQGCTFSFYLPQVEKQ